MEAVIAALRVMRLVTYFDVSATTFFVVDYLLTFGLELQYVWKRPKWGLVHVLFVVQRYLPFIDTAFLALLHRLAGSMTAKQCRLAYYIGACSMATGAGAVILALRTWAVWNHNKRVGVAFLVLFVSIWGVMFFLVVGFVRSLTFTEEPYPGFRGCLVMPANQAMMFVWCLIMAWDTIILGFMLVPGLKHYPGGSGSALVKVVYRDGIVYYIYLCALSCLNIAVVRALPYSYQNLLTSIERTFHSAMSSRVLLDIRATLNAPYNLTELVAEAYGGDVGAVDNELVFARRNTSGGKLKEQMSDAQAQADADMASQGEMIPGGRVTPLPQNQTALGVDVLV